MPLTRSRDYSPAPEIDEEELKRRAKARRKFETILEDAADEEEAVLVTVLKNLGMKVFRKDPVQGYLIRFVVLTGDHAGHVEEELPTYKGGWVRRIERAGVNATFVARLGRFNTANGSGIGLEDDKGEEDVEIAKAWLREHDPEVLEDAESSNGNGSGSRTSVTEGIAEANKEVKARAKEKAAAEAAMTEPPF